MSTQMVAPAAVGPALKERRQQLRLTRQELGTRAGGVSISTIARIEHGEVVPHPSTVSALERVLDMLDDGAQNDHELPAQELVGKVGNADAQPPE